MSLSNLVSGLKGGVSAPAISHEDFVAAVHSGTHHIIDVREPHEYAGGHVPGAINHPLSQFDPAQLPSEKPVVLLCQAGARSARALQAAQTAGLTHVAHYPPGTGGWLAQGGPLDK